MKKPTTCATRLVPLAIAGLAGLAGCGDTNTVYIEDGGQTIYVYPDLAAPSVAIEGSAHSVEVGKELALSAKTTGGSDSAYTWSTSDDKIATVNGGKVTGVAKGEVVITAKGETTKVSATRTIVVVQPQPVSVTVSGEYQIFINATSKLAATTQNGTDSGYDWASSDAKIASVTGDGTVTGLIGGKVTITATGKDSKKAGTFNMVISNDVTNLAAWAASPHADRNSEPFRHWDSAMPQEVPVSCAKCHSKGGFFDFIGADGSPFGVVDKAQPVNTVIDCGTCHNATAQQLSSVTFPSGVTITGLGKEAICMSCHQGRASTDSVDKMILAAAPKDDDTVTKGITFQNIHYYAAGATLQAGRVRGGYQYANQKYDWRFRHVPGYDVCQGCHDPHSLQVKVADCAKCHAGVAKLDDLKKIRMISSATRDYDGDGNVAEGLSEELDGLRTKLEAAIKAYAVDNALDKICYSPSAYPYFLVDANGNGTCDMGETTGYTMWTARLARAAYNYQVSLKDPGAFAHNGKYIIELLFDSITSLNAKLKVPVDMAKATREDPGHFNGTAEAFRDWDAQAEVPTACTRCHGGSDGFRFYIKYGATAQGIEQNNGLDCYTCHDKFSANNADYKTLFKVTQVTLPSTIVIKPDANTNKLTEATMLCMNCHTGRESKATVDASINSGKPAFRNIHYLAAGSTLLGTSGKVGYEYLNKVYAGQWTHTGGVNCIQCHSPANTKHTFAVADNIKYCSDVCHAGIKDVSEIRTNKSSVDYDGDGNLKEPLAGELTGLRDKVLAQMQVLTSKGICYTGAAYPYWFKDTNMNGVCEPTESDDRTKGFSAWTAPLVKAAFNYQMSVKDPGAWAHNFAYMGQLLFDSLEDLGGSTQGLTRP